MQVSFSSYLVKYIWNWNLPRNRGNPSIVEAGGLQKCFLTGGNSILCQHCQQYYVIYKLKCEEANVPLNHHAIPPKLAQMERQRESTQMTLDDKLVNRGTDTFSRDGLMLAVAQFVACDDQVSFQMMIVHQFTYTHLEGFCCGE
jgi:hypothetical protein